MNSKSTNLQRLEAQIKQATGRDTNLDRAIFRVLAAGKHPESAPAYTASVDSCIALIGDVLPDWHWHVGYGARGIMPYAALDNANAPDDDTKSRFEVSAPTVPLALLRAAVLALASQSQN